MAIKITSDSTCDLSKDLLERYQVTVMPLCVNLGDKVYRDGESIMPTDIFNYVSETGNLPTTSAINIGDYQDFFAPLAAEYEAVIHINLGSGFSSCHQNALLAAEVFDNVYAVDSCNLSSGQGLLVIEAALAAQRGEKAEDIVAMLKELTGRIDTSFVLDKLDYLVKGGRCSSVVALGANLLKLKPCINLEHGKMDVGKKYRGVWSKTLPGYAKDRLEGKDVCKDRVFITWTSCPPEVVAELRAQLEAEGFGEILETVAGSTVTSHCGPNTLGVLFIRNK